MAFEVKNGQFLDPSRKVDYSRRLCDHCAK
jgi:hypothetical protein